MNFILGHFHPAVLYTFRLHGHSPKNHRKCFYKMAVQYEAIRDLSLL